MPNLLPSVCHFSSFRTSLGYIYDTYEREEKVLLEQIYIITYSEDAPLLLRYIILLILGFSQGAKCPLSASESIKVSDRTTMLSPC